ncbi:MAG TPA: glycosyltransferase [Burkholderiales bacterium]|nr:glycosyltransferase [Burkholderiales bacterium]
MQHEDRDEPGGVAQQESPADAGVGQRDHGALGQFFQGRHTLSTLLQTAAAGRKISADKRELHRKTGAHGCARRRHGFTLVVFRATLERMSNPDASSTPGPTLRVLHIVSGDLWAGAEAQVHQLLRAANGVAGLEIRAVVLNPGVLAERLAAEGIAVMLMDEAHHSFPALAAGVVKLARGWRPQVIHTHRRKEHLLGALAAAFSGAGLVGTVHGRGEFAHSRLNLRQKALGVAERLVLARCHDRLIAVSDEMAGELPGPTAHAVVIPNSIDADAIRRAAAEPAPGMEPDGRIRIGFLGRLVPVKQVDHMLEMMALLEKEQPGRYSLHIVGDGPLCEALHQAASGLSIRDAVSFHGFLSDPLPILARMSMLLFASAHEGLPMTALEALSLGVPIVSPPIGTLARLISESGAGGVAASAAPRHLADAVSDLPVEELPECGLRRCRLPERYRIASGLGATIRLWREVSPGAGM